MTPAAGWHPDPAGRFQHRYHDGTRWTEHVATAGRQDRDAASLSFLNAAAPGSGAPGDPLVPASLTAARAPAGPRPSNAGFWVAGAVAAVAVVAAITVGVLGFVATVSQADDYARATIPGQVAVTVDGGGTKVVYYEGGLRPTREALGLSVSGPDGADVQVGDYGADVTYDVSGHSGRAVAEFAAPARGRYLVRASQAPEVGARIAVGGDLGHDLIWAFARPAIILIAGLLLAGLIAGGTAIRQSRRRRTAPTS